MRILIAGASGFIGKALTKSLAGDGHQVIPLVRREAGEGEVRWQPSAGEIDIGQIGKVDAAINLSGEGVFGRWTAEKKARILSSRIDATQTLAKALPLLHPLPSVFVSASGTNYYGDRGDGTGFLADVCAQWEAATAPATDAGIRVVNARMGIVLGNGGSLKKMLPPFRLGLGARLGSGKQYMSWIAIQDVVEAYKFVIKTPTISGPVNFCSPNPVSNSEFTSTLAKLLHRPAIFSLPAFALRIFLGEAADDLLLSSVRVTSTRLIANGFSFRFPKLEPALAAALES